MFNLYSFLLDKGESTGLIHGRPEFKPCNKATPCNYVNFKTLKLFYLNPLGIPASLEFQSWPTYRCRNVVCPFVPDSNGVLVSHAARNVDVQEVLLLSGRDDMMRSADIHRWLVAAAFAFLIRKASPGESGQQLPPHPARRVILRQGRGRRRKFSGR